MIAIDQDRPATMEDAVDRPCQPRADGRHAARQCRAMRGFDDEMDVVRLKRVVHDPERPALAGASNVLLELTDHLHGSKRGDVGPHAKRHMRWMASHHVGAGDVRQTGVIAGGLATGSGTTPAPTRTSRKRQTQL